jgi:hypothetical protein
LRGHLSSFCKVAHTKGGVKGEFFFIGRILKTVPIQERERERATLDSPRRETEGVFFVFVSSRAKRIETDLIRIAFLPARIEPHFFPRKRKKRSNSLSNRGERRIPFVQE